MRWLVCLAALLAVRVVPARAAGLDTALVGRVFSTALAFTAPRVLDPATPAQLTLWGLQGLTTLDPEVAIATKGAALRVSSGAHVLLERPMPPTDNADAWAKLATDMIAAAYEASPVLRRNGQQALIQGFFDEAFNHLDPYSRYVPPAPAEDERDKLSIDASAGIGLVRQGRSLVVNDLVPGGPGAASGMRIGDTILSVDRRATIGMRQARLAALLTGQEGQRKDLRVRGLDGVARNVSLTLAYVPPETVFATRDGELLILRVTSFVANTAERLSQAIEAGLVAGKPPAALLIDLRGNRGGLLRQAVTSVALFAEQGVIASTAGRDPQATHDWRIDGGGDLTHGLRVILLVDGGTASAAEVMAAALADLGRAVVVGSSTLGKGLVQTITTLPDGGELFVSWSRVLAPRGWPIQSLGVLPQLCTSLGQEKLDRSLAELEDGRNPMASALEAARAARAPLAVAEALKLRVPCPAAEGGPADMTAAHFLAGHPPAYAAALLR
jgi:carboxyl-terminal processing protease